MQEPRAADDDDRQQPHSDHPALKLQTFLPHLLNVCSTQVSQALSRIYADRYKIGIPEWRVLAMLGEYGSLTAKAIGMHSCMHKTKVSRAVSTLERRKLVARRANREDLREAFLSLTPAGRELYDSVAPVAVDFAEKLVANVEPKDRPALERALQRLIESTGTLDIANPRRRG
jgi:DNA-binding MarR family transcriptional regulator